MAGEITAEHEAAFLRDRAQCRILKGGDALSLSGITDWLQDEGVIGSRAAVSAGASGIEAIVQEYTAWLRSFFRFARYRDYIQADLAAVVPSVAGWSMVKQDGPCRSTVPCWTSWPMPAISRRCRSQRSGFRPPDRRPAWRACGHHHPYRRLPRLIA